MDKLQVVQRNQLKDYINSGSVASLQNYFAEATSGFQRLVQIANGEMVNGDVPTFGEQIQAMKLIMDKAFPSLKASHVTQHHVSQSKLDNDIDVSGLLEELDDLTKQAEAMKKAEVV